ncbi:branched-chain amino acid transport system ATP-binding protein [Caldicoprobacter guelmensis]|uniref:ABC transporter ATP-binding protein n=1 Tax=Caldicoprobacter guelmensis TaxID=1170224 RepID=UPI00195B0506|nr:ABC transporter ATP-binding protein [Caldicoprobacter guelmensis]MBM7581786.1 branched-chain amino acid transport system ATP-binding protein [Caldicoprobacter guelmensis]
MPLLKVNKLTKSFGGLTAVLNVNIELKQGELVGLIGPNGAGKTTVFNLLTGVYVPTSGSIVLNKDGVEQKLQGLKPHRICKAGVARTFQNIRLFKDLTVFDNVRIAMHKDVRYGLLSSFLHLPSYHREEKRISEATMELLRIFKLDDKKDEYAKNLPYGEQRRLEIARALATNPSLLLLDEPAAGMNPAETAQLTELIKWIRERFNLTILLIEHDMSLVMKICERIYVLDYGILIAEGTPDEIRSNKRVIEAYLGEDVGDA